MCIICSGDYDINITTLHICKKITNIPKELINLKVLYYSYKFNIIEREIPKFIKKFNLVRKLSNLYRFNKKLPTLWKIAEYYTQKKYNPNNILKYIDLD